MSQLSVGIKVSISDHNGKIEEAIVRNVGTGLNPENNGKTIMIESIPLTGDLSEFAFSKEHNAWRLLFEGALGERCFNTRAPLYYIEQVKSTGLKN